MFPTVSVFGHDIGSYSICAVIGMLFASVYMYFQVKRRDDLDSVQIINIAAVAGLGAFIGAHILFGVTKWRELAAALSEPAQTFGSLKVFLTRFLEVFGGMVFYGGLLGGFLTGVWYVKHLKHIRLDPRVYADAYAPAIPLFHVFGRIGCFLGGCCYGIECRWGFMYHSAPIPESNGVVRLPIQLIESVGNLILFLVLHRLSKKKHVNGMVFISYMILYSIMRFILEFFRGDTVRGFLLGLSTSQWVSLIIFISSCISIKVIGRNETDITGQ